MKRALNITKTLFGMVDEMDTTDFCAQKDSAQVVLLKEKSETENQSDKKKEKTDEKPRSTDILNLVSNIEGDMGIYKYSRLKALNQTYGKDHNR